MICNSIQRVQHVSHVSPQRATLGSCPRTLRISQNTRTKAYVEASTELAVTQQAAAYAIVLAGEAVYSSFKLPETDPGRPNPIPVAIGVVGTVLVTSQVAGGNPEVQVPAFIGGLVVSGAMMAYCIKRGSDTTTDDNDWPGARAPAYVMALISFFALNVFFQGLKAAFI